MQTLVTIGQFSRLTHLTVTTLRHYHEVGLLTPVRIDASGYRRYGVDQVQQAQLVRRLRQLDMPVPDVAAVLAAPNEKPGTSRSPSTWPGWRKPSTAQHK